MTEEESGLNANQQAGLDLLLANLPDDYSGRYAELVKIRHAFHQAIATALQPSFNEAVSAKPQDTPEERQDLATWINGQLRDIGLSVQCPKSKQPAVLIVDRQDAEHPEISRFRFGVRSDQGKYALTAARRNLCELNLVEHRPRIEPGTRTYRRNHPGGPGR